MNSSNSGKYTIVLTNSKGSTEQTTKITVKEPTPAPQASEELTFINPLKDLSVVDGKSSIIFIVIALRIDFTPFLFLINPYL